MANYHDLVLSFDLFVCLFWGKGVGLPGQIENGDCTNAKTVDEITQNNLL